VLLTTHLNYEYVPRSKYVDLYIRVASTVLMVSCLTKLSAGHPLPFHCARYSGILSVPFDIQSGELTGPVLDPFLKQNIPLQVATTDSG
jgi:hypothetical protein